MFQCFCYGQWHWRFEWRLIASCLVCHGFWCERESLLALVAVDKLFSGGTKIHKYAYPWLTDESTSTLCIHNFIDSLVHICKKKRKKSVCVWNRWYIEHTHMHARAHTHRYTLHAVHNSLPLSLKKQQQTNIDLRARACVCSQYHLQSDKTWRETNQTKRSAFVHAGSGS